MAKEPADVMEVVDCSTSVDQQLQRMDPRRQSLTGAQTGDRNWLSAGVGWQLQTMVAECNPHGRAVNVNESVVTAILKRSSDIGLQNKSVN